MKHEDPCAASGSESPYAILFQKQRKRSVLTLLLTSAADHSCSCLVDHGDSSLVLEEHTGALAGRHEEESCAGASNKLHAAGQVCSASTASVWMSLCVMVSLCFGLITGLVSAQGTTAARSPSHWRALLQKPSAVPSPWLSVEGGLTWVTCKPYSAHGAHGP